MQIIYSSKFAREYKKLTSELKSVAKKKEKIFRKDPFDIRLKTHKLSGDLEGFLSFSLDFKNRIIFEFDDTKKVVYFHSVGSHDIYK